MPAQLYTLEDLKENRTPLLEFDQDSLVASLQADLDAYNMTVSEGLSAISVDTTDRESGRGGQRASSMRRVGRIGRSPAPKPQPGANVHFPLFKFERNVGFDREFMESATVRDMAVAQNDVKLAHMLTQYDELRQAMYFKSNYQIDDKFGLKDNAILTVRRFLNGDGDPIGMGPDSLQEFDGSTHSHYLGVATAGTLTDADLEALVFTVVEHGFTGRVVIEIHYLDIGRFDALPKFRPALSDLVVPSTTVVNPVTQPSASEMNRVSNKFIGIWNNTVEIWTKPYTVPGRLLCYDRADSRKPLKRRLRPQPRLRGLYLAGQNHAHPLYADFYEAYQGFGAWTREAAAVLDVTATAYSDPAI